VRVFAEPPVRCGHRGAGRGPGENTLASFEAAVAAGLEWVEVDARLAADGVLVACHDPVLGDGRFVSDLPAAETGLLGVEELLAALPEHVGVNVDLKTSLEDAARPRDATTAAAVAALAAGQPRPMLVMSFDPAALLIVRDRAPDLPIGLLTWLRFPLREAIPAAVHLGADVVGVHVEGFHAEWRPIAESVAVAHAAGLQVLAWCPEPAAEEALVVAGVDCLVIDDVITRS
jgi:glycerophosphoryl diester phosphodiesterase